MTSAIIQTRVGVALAETPFLHPIQPTLGPPPQVLQLPVEDESTDTTYIPVSEIHGGACVGSVVLMGVGVWVGVVLMGVWVCVVLMGVCVCVGG